MNNPKITRIEWGRLDAKRPRSAGANARLGVHGDHVVLPLVRLTTDTGVSGFGFSWAGPDSANALLGMSLDALFSEAEGVLEAGRAYEFPLWDLIGQIQNKPVYALAAAVNGQPVPETLRVPCYDTSLYFDDLHLSSTADAAKLMAGEAREGLAFGHRAFKLKVGRGARHLPPGDGLARDIAVIQAVREAVGPECKLMLDANNGYTLNLAKQVLTETADCNLFWLEEAFGEDDVLYRDLKAWLAERRLNVLIADGEGDASLRLLDWAKAGLIDVVQYDIFGYGFTPWLHLGAQLDAWGVRSAPHHYGGLYGNYASGHLAPALRGFTSVEWDAAAAPGLDTSHYSIDNGHVIIPNAPGFGLSLDAAAFQQAATENGGSVSY
jgi:L-rhamnonate dehydratase